jgi:cell wall-associated NlpC family hydrolase
MDPVYASTQFYSHLLAVPGWQTMPLAQAAQTVQRSATPEAYGRWEPDAIRIVAALTGVAGPSALAGCATDADAVPPGFTLPPDTPPAVVAAIVWAFGQLGTPYAFGGDCTNAHGGDPAKQCDCSTLVIFSAGLVQGHDLQERVEDTAVNTATVNTPGLQWVGGIVAKLQSLRSVCVPGWACGREVPR